MNHYWDFAVKFLPLWLAPNLITLLGLGHLWGGALLVVAFSPTLDEALPSWVSSAAAGVLLVLILDA
jgi:ethanolaminephosphotransferase